jgi:hypothetical protein
MSKQKDYSTSLIQFTKFISLIAAISISLLCWMFSVASTVGLLSGSFANADKEQIEGINIANNIADNLDGAALGFSLATLVLAALYFIQTRNSDKNAKNKLIGVIIIGVILMSSVVLRENILQRLIISG